ncbi:MAG: hypothetical protein OHK0022_05690 [Roseiflexaceae bacterium]
MTRRVHSLYLRAPGEALVRRGALLVEDALRTASLPESQRLVLIRRLDIGAIRPARSPAALALQIEACVAALGPALVYADLPDAATAPAVFFADATEPYALLALRVLAQRSAPEWFWPLAVPGWQPHSRPAPPQAIWLLARAAERYGPAAGVRVAETLQRHGALATLLAALDAASATELLRAFGWQPAAEPTATDDLPRGLAEAWAIPHWAARWGASAAPSRWLAAVALAANRPARLAQPARLLAQATALAQQVATRQEAAAPPTPQTTTPATAPALPPAPQTAGEELPASVPGKATAPLELPPPVEERAWSAGAGLLLALAALERLGMAALLRRAPALAEATLPERVLQTLAERAAIPATDPIRALLPIRPNPPAPTAFALPAWAALARHPLRLCRLPGGWQARTDATGELLLALRRERPGHVLPARRPTPRRRGPRLRPGRPEQVWALLARSWAVAVERWLELYAGLGLAELVARSGFVRATPAHIELFFAHEQADIRIRRAGLDIDPGWVAWLGRVVVFHYVADPSAA